jgi:phospholipid/cholesterol/gamma-HCH transport system substrate-binding protein
MTKPAAALWRLAITGVVTIVLFILLANALTQPVAPSIRSYTAEFTDASGLYAGADVRVRGVRVGKVQSVDLDRRHGQSIAAVGFTLERRYGVVSATRLAIKYQSLTGSRYVDVVNPSESYSQAAVVSHVATSMTQPSFDITALFNGLQPVLATLSPEEINTFTANAASFLSGDSNGEGDGLASMLKSIHTLTRFLSNRQQVVATLMRNLSTVADAMGGQSKDMIQLLQWVNRPLDGALAVVDEFRKTSLYSVDFLAPLSQLVSNLGFPPVGNSASRLVTEPFGAADTNVSNVDQGLDRAITNLDNFIDAFKLVPVMWESIGPPSSIGAAVPCSRGRFQLPEQMDVLLNGQRVVLCNQ